MSTNNYDVQKSHKSILKATSKLSIGTLFSRVLGFVRMVLLARLLGTSLYADAFFMAFKLPNLFRALVGEGATNSAVVPVMSEYLHKEQRNRQDFWMFVSVVVTIAFMVLSAITILSIIFAPYIIKLVAPGFIGNTEKFLITVKLLRVMFPYLIFIGMSAYFMGILYTFKSFTVPAFSPSLLNISIIASILIASGFSNKADATMVLAGGVLLGGMMQMFAYFPALKKIGMKYRVPTRIDHPGAQKICKLMIPRMIGSGVYQINVLVDTFCASLSSVVGGGGISAISFSNLLINFPIGIFATSLSSAILPEVSKNFVLNEYEKAKHTINMALRNILIIMVPISVVTFFFSGLIVKILFQRGMFNEYSTQITSNALLFYSIGLFAFGANKILITAFHSFQDTKTPVKIAAVCLILNAVLNFILMYPLKIGGIALASSISGILNFVLLYILFKRKMKELM